MLLEWIDVEQKRYQLQSASKTSVRAICDDFALQMHKKWADDDSHPQNGGQGPSAILAKRAAQLGEALANDIASAKNRRRKRRNRQRVTKSEKQKSK